jgi:hypothetical protein
MPQPDRIDHLTPIALDVGDGFIQTTQFRTLARFQTSLRAADDFAALKRQAEAQSSRRTPHPHRMLLVIAQTIRAPIPEPDGGEVLAVSEMSPNEIDHCRACFGAFMDLVFVCTGGALQIEATEWLTERPITRLSSPGQQRYWLTAQDALADDLARIPEGTFDSIGVYYKMPAGLTAALHGGAVGRDQGVRGSAYWTLWITSWDESHSPFSQTAIASLHEWLHNVSFYAHRVMGDMAVPDCHAGEEYGYWDLDGGYPQWQAWNRDLMLRYIPRSFWYRLTSQGTLLPPGAPPTFRSPDAGPFFRWDEVAHDWMRKLPRLDEPELRRLTGLPDLNIETGQPGPNSHLIWGIRTSTPVASPYHAGPLVYAPCRLDNILAYGRRPEPTRPGDPSGGYATAPLESLAWLRSPAAPADRRDLLVVRPDVAPWVLPRLRTVGPPATDRMVGYLNRQDPAEGQQVNVLVVAADFGTRPPADEVDAVQGSG